MLRVDKTAEGTCPRCGRTLVRPRPCKVAVCDCHKFCPQDHGKGAYQTAMSPYTQDQTPSTYGPIDPGESDAWGDLDHPMNIRYVCLACSYHSAQLPVEVKLS